MATFSPGSPVKRENPFDRETVRPDDDPFVPLDLPASPISPTTPAEPRPSLLPSTAPEEIADCLGRGLLAHVLPPLDKSKKSLDELLRKQETVLDGIRLENQRFDDSQSNDRLRQRMSRVKSYHERLVNIRRSMTSLHERTTRLKRRALKLQSEKQKEALAREAAKDREREREKKLVAAPVLAPGATAPPQPQPPS